MVWSKMNLLQVPFSLITGALSLSARRCRPSTIGGFRINIGSPPKANTGPPSARAAGISIRNVVYQFSRHLAGQQHHVIAGEQTIEFFLTATEDLLIEYTLPAPGIRYVLRHHMFQTDERMLPW